MNKIKSKNIIKITFEYIKTKDLYLLFKYNKSLQRKLLNIDLSDYKVIYYNKMIKWEDYLNFSEKELYENSKNKDDTEYNGQYLIKKMENALLKFNIKLNDDLLHRCVANYFKNYNFQQNLKIDLNSPLLILYQKKNIFMSISLLKFL